MDCHASRMFTFLLLFVLSCITSNRVIGFSFPTTGSQSLCFITDPSRYVNISNLPFRGAAIVGRSSHPLHSTWTGQTSVCLKSTAGSGLAVAVQFTLNQAVESGDDLDYETGNIASLASPQQFPTTGGLLIYLFGSGFGVYDFSPSSNFGFGKILSRQQPMLLASYSASTKSSVTLWTSDSSVRFLTSIGNGRGTSVDFGETNSKMLVLKLGPVTASATSMFTFESPVILPNVQEKLSTGSMMCVIGSSFSIWNGSPKTAFFRGSSATLSNWISDSAVLAKPILSQFNGSTPVFVSVASQFGKQTVPWNSSMIFSLDSMSVPSTGSVLNQTSGQGFGLHQNSALSRTLYSAFQFTRWVSDSHIRIKIPPSQGKLFGISLTVNHFTGLFASHLEVPRHTVLKSEHKTRMPSSGSYSLSFNLFSGGTYDQSYRCRLQNSSPSSFTSSFWKSDSSIAAKFSSGSLSNFGIFVSLKSVVASASGMASNLTGEVSSHLPRCLPITGSQKQFITGYSLDSSDLSARARLMNTDCQSSAWKSDSAVICKSPDISNLGWNALFALISTPFHGIKSNSAMGAMAIYIQADSIASAPLSSSCTGSQLVTITFNSYSISDMSIQVRSGSSESRTSFWMSHSSVVVKVSPGSGTNHSVFSSILSILCDHQKYNVFSSMSYIPQTLNHTLIVQRRIVSTGSSMYQVFGMNFGVVSRSISTRLKAASNSMLESTIWIADSALQCKCPSILFRNISLLMSCEKRSSSPVPIRLGDENANVTTLFANASGLVHTGSFFVQLVSNSFGMMSISAKILIASSSSELSLWLSDSSIGCKEPPRTRSGLQNVVVSMSMFLSAQGVIYQHPGETVLATMNSSISPSSASTIITILGAFQICDHSPQVKLAPSNCLRSIWISSSSLKCKFHSGIVPTWTVVVSALLSSASFVVDNVKWSELPTQSNLSFIASGSIVARIMGGGLGMFDSSVRPKIGHSNGLCSQWISDSQLNSKYVSGHGRLTAVYISVGKNVRPSSLLHSCHSFSLPPVTFFGNMAGTNISTGSIANGLVSSVGMGTFGYSGQLRQHFSGAEASNWISDSMMIVKSCHGMNPNTKVLLTIAIETSETSTSVSEPQHSNVSISNALQPVTGSLLLELSGQSMIICHSSIGIRTGSSASVLSNWISSSSIVVKKSAGTKSIELMSISSVSFVKTAVNHISYLRPGLIVNSESRLSTCGLLITITGIFSGVSSQTMIVRLVSSSSQRTRWISSSALTGMSISGPGYIPNVFVSYSEFTGNTTSNISFEVPLIKSFNDSDFAVSGSSTIWISGSCFGVFDVSAKGRNVASSNEATRWISFSSTRAKLHHRSRQEQQIVLSFANSKSNSRLFDCSISAFCGPSISGVSANSSLMNSGSFFIAVTGNHFMTNNKSPTIRFTSSSSSMSTWISDTSVTAKAISSAFEVRHRVDLSMGSGTFFIISNVSANATSISSMSSYVAPATGSILITMFGVGFGNFWTSSSVEVGVLSPQVTWTSDSCVSCRLNAFVSSSVRTKWNGFKTLSPELFFDSMTISSLSKYNSPVVQANARTMVFGSDFGIQDPTMAVLIDSQKIATSWVSESCVVAIPALGTGQNLTITILSHHVAGKPVLLAFSYDTLTLFDDTDKYIPTAGGKINIFGSNLGTGMLPVPSVSVGLTACNQVLRPVMDFITCIVQPGAGQSLSICAYRSAEAFCLPFSFSYRAPVVSDFQSSTSALPSSGKSVVTLFGRDFGLLSYSAVSRLSRQDQLSTQSMSTVWLSTTSMKSLGSRAVGDQITVFASVSLQNSNRIQRFGSLPLSPLFQSSIKAPVTSSFYFELFSRNLGLSGHSSRSNFLKSSSEASVWTSDSLILVKSCRRGPLSNRTSTISVQLLIGSTAAISAECRPYISLTTFSDTGKTSSGSMIVTITGGNFQLIDTSPSARFIRSVNENVFWLSDSIVVSKASAWIHSAMSHLMLITSNGETFSIVAQSVISEVENSELRQLIGVTGLFNGNRTNLIQSTGSTSVIILGTAFGLTDSTLVVKFLATSFTSTSWTSQSSIHCKFFAFSSRKHGNGAVLSVNSHLIYPFTWSLYSFRAPTVSSLPSLSPSTGSLSDSRFYAAIGCFDQTVKTRLQLSASESSQWLSDSSMIIKISSGSGDAYGLHISIDSTSFSLSFNASYFAFALVSSLAANLSSSGSVQISCYGSSFGVDKSSFRVRYFHTAEESTFWTSDSSMNFKISSFAQKFHPSVIVSFLGQREGFLFNHSQMIYGISTHYLNHSIPSTGSSIISLKGSGMLQFEMSNKVSFGSSVCGISLWMSTSSMFCKVPKYSFATFKVSISVNHELISSTNISHIMCDVSWSNSSYKFPTTGSIVQLPTTGFGIFDISAKLSFLTSCEFTTWRADSSISCKSSQSQSKLVGMVATLATKKIISDMMFSVSAPGISAVHPSITPSTGSGILTVSGSGFLFHNMSLLPMKIGSTPLHNALYVSDSSLLTTTPAGEGLVSVYFEKNQAVSGSMTYSFGSIDVISTFLSNLQTGHIAQLQILFSISQRIEKLGMIFVYLPSQLQLQSQSTSLWDHGIPDESGKWSMQSNFACFQSYVIISPGNFSMFVNDIVLSSTVIELSSLVVRSSMASNITIDAGSFDFNKSIIPSNATEFTITPSRSFYAGDIVNVSVFLKPFNSVQVGDVFVIKFPESGASFTSTNLLPTEEVSLLQHSHIAFKIKALTTNSVNYTFVLSGILLQPFSGKLSTFSGNHCNHLGILKENWVETDSFHIQPGRMQNVRIKLSNATIGSTSSLFISFITANDVSMNSIIVVEFDQNDVSFTNEVFLDSQKLLSFYDGYKKMAIQIPKPIMSGTTVNITFLNSFINLGPSRSTSAKISSQFFHSAWNFTALYEPIMIDIGSSNSIDLIAPQFLIRSRFSSLQMRTKVYLNMTMQIPNTLPSSGYIEIVLFNHLRFSQTTITITSNCFDSGNYSVLMTGTKAFSSIRSMHSAAFQSCFILVGPILSPGFPGYDGKASLLIRSEYGIFAFGESNTEFFFVSFLSAQITGNCSVSLSWNNTGLVELPESWAISCTACTEMFRRKTYAPHLHFYNYNNMPCLSGFEFEFVLREIDTNGTAVIPKAFDNLDPFEPDQWSIKLLLETLPSAPQITNLNQTIARRVTFNWISSSECYDGTAAYCPIASSLISVTSMCHPIPDVYSTTTSFFDITFEYSTNHTVCVSFINIAGTSVPACFHQRVDQPYQSSASISFVEAPTNIIAGSTFTPVVSVLLTSISDPLENLTIFSSFIINETKAFVASYQSCAVTSQNGLATFTKMSLAGIGTATMDAFLSTSQSVRSPKFQITIGIAAKVSLLDLSQVVVAAMKFPRNLIAEVTDKVENVHSELVFDATLTFKSAFDSNRSFPPFFAKSNNGIVSFENVSIAEVGDYFGRIHILNFQSSIFLVTVMSGASILIEAEIQPSDSSGGEIFAPRQPLLTLRDRGNNIAIDYFDYVTVTFDYASEARATIMGISEKFSYLGVCRFYDMAIDLVGHYRFKYSAVGLIPAYSNTIVVVVGAPFKLGILKQPSKAIAASIVLDFASVKVVDRGGNVVNKSNATVLAELFDFFVMIPLGALSVDCIFGIAVFPNIPIRNNGTSYIVAFSASRLQPINSQLFAVVPGPAALASITSFPAYGLGGLIFEPTVRLMGLDSWGNALHSGYADGPDRTAFVSIPNCSHISCLDKLLGNRSSHFYNGLAVFSNSAISLVGWYVLRFSIENVTVSRNITIYHSNATFLTVEREPATCFGGQKCIIQPMITVRDIATNIVESHESVLNFDILANTSIHNMTWRFLGTTASFSHGVAVFEDFGFDRIGIYSVTFGYLGIIPCSISVNVIAGPRSSFQLTQYPGLNSSGGSVLSIQPILTFYDLGLNVANVANATTSVVLLFSNGTQIMPTSGNLFGDLNVMSDGPVVTFQNIGIRTAALGYILRFSSAMVPDVMHHPINVYPGVAHSMRIQNHPTEAFGAQVFVPQPEIWLLDLGDNIAVNNHDIVTVSILFTTNFQSRILGTRSVSASFGVCNFFDLAIDLTGIHIFLFSTQGINASVSPNITIFIGPSAGLRLGSQPSNISGGLQFRPFVHVEVIDLGGNVVVNNNFSVIKASLITRDGSASLLGNLTSTSSSGIANFTNITVDKIGQNFSLHFTTDFSGVLSDTFSVTIGDLNVLNVTTAPSNVIAGQCMYPMPIFGLFDAGWNVIYSEEYTAVARLSPDSIHLLEFRNVSQNGMFVFGCINSTSAGQSSIVLFISPGSLVFPTLNFTTIHGRSHHMISSRFPLSAFCGVPFSTQPITRIVDEYENHVYFEAAPAISVHASLIDSSTGQSILFGPTTRDVELDGSVHFDALRIDLYTSTNWRITFTPNTSGILKLILPGIRMNYGDAVKLRIPTEVISAQSGRNILPYCVIVLDTGGNRKEDYIGSIIANISKAFTPKWIPMAINSFSIDMQMNTSIGQACFSFALSVNAIFSLKFVLQNEPNVFIETPLFTVSECEVRNITFTSPSIQNVGGGSILIPHPRIEINGAGCESSGESIFNVSAFIIFANGSVPIRSELKGDLTAHAVNGRIEFKNLIIDRSDGPYVIEFVFGTFTVQSNNFFVLIGPTQLMHIVKQASSMNVAGENIIIQPSVGFFDIGMNLNKTMKFDVNATLFDYDSKVSPLSGNNIVSSSEGLAVFQNLKVNLAASNWTLVFSCVGFVSITSDSFQTKVGLPFELILTDDSQPVNSTACLFFPVQPMVIIVDKGGNTVPAGSVGYPQENLLTFISFQGNYTSLYEWEAFPSHLGVFQLANLTYCQRGFNFEFSFILNNSLVPRIVSRAFSIPIGIAMSLAVFQEPSDVIAGEFMQPAVSAGAQFHDGSFAPDANMMHVNLISNSSNISVRIDVLPMTEGLEVRSLFVWNHTGFFRIEFNLNGLKATSIVFEIKHGHPQKLSIRTQPSNTFATQIFFPPPDVLVLDRYGNFASVSDIMITATLFIQGNSSVLHPSPILAGRNVCNSNLGLCSFHNLSINKAYHSYRIIFSSINFTFSIDSTQFKIKDGAPVRMIMLSEPPSSFAAAELFPQPIQVALLDLGGNIAEAGSFEIRANSSFSSTWTISNATILGVASFFGIEINAAGSYIIKFSSIGFDSIRSCTFTIVPGALIQIEFEPVADGISVHSLFSKEYYPIVTLRDRGSNIVSVSRQITLFMNVSNNNASLRGNVSVWSLSGVASFENVYIEKVGVNYQLLASCNNSGSFLFAQSSQFDIIPGPPTIMSIYGSVGLNANGLNSLFFFTTKLVPSVCLLITDGAGNGLYNIAAEISSVGVSNSELSGNLVAHTDDYGISCFQNLILNGVFNSSVTFSFITKFNGSNISMSVSGISVLPQLDIEAILDGTFISFSSTIKVPPSYREATSAAFGLNMPLIFDEATYKSFGVGAKCMWTSDNQFVVTLGTSPTFVMQDRVRFVPSFLQDLFFFEHSKLRFIKTPLILPNINIVFGGSTTVFGCGSVRMDIFDSTGFYGRPFLTQWILKNISHFQLSGNYSVLSVFNAVASQLSNWNDSYFFEISKLTIGNSTLELPPAVYTFEVEAIRWVDGKRQVSEISVTKSNDVIPTVSILGPRSMSMLIHQGLELIGTASAACGSSASFDFFWQITNSLNSIVLITFTGSSLTVPEYTFSLASTYDVTLTVTSGTLQNFDKVKIIPRRSFPVLNIKGGNGTFVLDSDLLLDSSPSIDKDGANFVDFVFEWACEFCNNSKCFITISSSESRLAIVSKSSLISNTLYVFSLTASTRDKSIISTSKVSLLMLSAGSPRVTVNSISRKVDPEKSLRLEGNVNPVQELIWSEITTNGVLLPSNIFPSSDSRVFVFRPNILPPGATLKIRLSTTSSTSFAEVEFLVNQAPFGGKMRVSSSPFVADIHLAEITMTGWTDDPSDLPIFFEFAVNHAGSVDLASAGSTSSTRILFLPSIDKTTIVAKISDSMGTSRQIYHSVALMNGAKTNVKLQNMGDAKADEIQLISSKLLVLKAAGDIGALISFCNAILATISKLSAIPTEIEVLRFEIISLISGSVPTFPPLRSSQAVLTATVLANCISNVSDIKSLVAVKNSALKLLNSSLINIKPTIIQKIMIISTLASFSTRLGSKRMLMQEDNVPDVESFFAFLNFLEQILSPSLVLGQDVSKHVVSGLSFVAAITQSQLLCQKVDISEVQTATEVSVSDSKCSFGNRTFGNPTTPSDPVVLLSWNVLSNPFSGVSSVKLKSAVLRFNVRVSSGSQMMNASSLQFTFKIYKRPAEWTSMTSLAICVKWEFDVSERDGHWSATNCRKIHEDFDHLICSCAGLSSVAVTIIQKDCVDEPYGIPGFKAHPSTCIPEQIAPIAIIAGILSAALVLSFLATVLYRRFRYRRELMKHHMQITLANIEETQNSLWTADTKAEGTPRKAIA